MLILFFVRNRGGPKPPKPKGLVHAARSKNKYIGVAVDNPYLEDKEYSDLVWDTKEFNHIVPENAQKVSGRSSYAMQNR
jgi:hypothetical protein